MRNIVYLLLLNCLSVFGQNEINLEAIAGEDAQLDTFINNNIDKVDTVLISYFMGSGVKGHFASKHIYLCFSNYIKDNSENSYNITSFKEKKKNNSLQKTYLYTTLATLNIGGHEIKVKCESSYSEAKENNKYDVSDSYYDPTFEYFNDGQWYLFTPLEFYTGSTNRYATNHINLGTLESQKYFSGIQGPEYHYYHIQMATIAEFTNSKSIHYNHESFIALLAKWMQNYYEEQPDDYKYIFGIDN